MKLLFATTNQGKLKEALQLLSSTELELLSLDSFKELQSVVVEESGETFEQNALLKAKFYGDSTQILTVAEDAGLVVNALDGRPGVHSARLGSSSADRNQRLLEMMKDKDDRFAQFVSVLCLYDPKAQTDQYFKGTINGRITNKIRGSQGFDYDFIFIPEGYDQTFAELGEAVKNQISHRKQAIEKLKTLMLS